jgi:hypothetical protein
MSRIRVELEAWSELLEIARYMVDVAKNRQAAVRLSDDFERKCEIYARQPRWATCAMTSATT